MKTLCCTCNGCTTSFITHFCNWGISPSHILCPLCGHPLDITTRVHKNAQTRTYEWYRPSNKQEFREAVMAIPEHAHAAGCKEAIMQYGDIVPMILRPLTPARKLTEEEYLKIEQQLDATTGQYNAAHIKDIETLVTA